jgi:predicted nucleotidyltransferase
MLDLHAPYQQMVVDIVRQHAPQATIYVFGSRTQGTAKPHSDLDLLLDSRQEVPRLQRASLRMAFEESDLPMRVDWLMWQEAPAHLRETARRSNVILS